MTEIEVGVYIDAPPSRVWQTLMDFAAYPEWNPFIREIAGRPAIGERLSVRIKPPGSAEMTFRPTVMAVEAARTFRWLGHFIVPGLFDGEHSFVVQPHGEGRTLLWQRENFAGLLPPIFRSTIGRTECGFCDMNVGLKARAEGRQQASRHDMERGTGLVDPEFAATVDAELGALFEKRGFTLRESNYTWRSFGCSWMVYDSRDFRVKPFNDRREGEQLTRVGRLGATAFETAGLEEVWRRLGLAETDWLYKSGAAIDRHYDRLAEFINSDKFLDLLPHH